MTVALVTGASGFVGPHLRAYLEKNNFDTYGIVKDKDARHYKNTMECNILDFDKLFTIISKIKPDYIFHLAAQGSVSYSWKNPELTFEVNVNGTKNLLDSVVKADINPKILIVSSSQVYGIPKKLPINEKHPLTPDNPYAKSKLEQERLCKKYDLDIVISRSFNHTGPGQAPTFVCSDFAKQIAEIKLGLRKPEINVGKLDIKRDFTDVRDVVKAYLLALEKGNSGEIYNICSGNAYSVREILKMLIEISELGGDIKIKKDNKKIEPNDIPILVGNNKKFNNQTGWSPEISMENTLRDLFEYWKNKLSKK